MASKTRRDNRNRVLRNGESQRKDGRYVYKYVDWSGKSCYVYSWKLEPTDRVPQGKRNCISLREKIRVIRRDIDDNILPFGENITVTQLVEKYVSQKIGVRHNTAANYKSIIKFLKNEEFGAWKIYRVRLSDAKAWLIKLQQKDGKSYSSIHAIRGVIRPAFQMAVDDDLLRKNPFDFKLGTVVINDSKNREALTAEQEQQFLNFVKEDEYYSRYYDAFYILFNTGLRISEFTGLTVSDINLKKNKLIVDHQLQRKRNMEYTIENTKTKCGKRIIPITEDVAECFRRIIENRKKLKVEPMVDGQCGFLFIDKNNMPMVALHWEKYIKHAWQKYNNTHSEKLPIITPHICRHTYCTKMSKTGINPKTLQYLMGHADIGVTMNTYTHIQFEDAEKELRRVGI